MLLLAHDAFILCLLWHNWTDRVQTKYCISTIPWHKEACWWVCVCLCFSLFVLLCGARCECMSVCVYICPESVSLHILLYVSAAAMQAPLWGFWEWAWCVYMVSGVAAVITNRCVLLLVSSLHCTDGRRVHDHTGLQALVQMYECMLGSLYHFSPCLITGVWSQHALQTPCLSLFWPLTHPCLEIKSYLVENVTRANTFFLPKCGLWLRFSFEHHVRGGCDRYRPSRRHWGKTFGNVHHLLSECGGTGERIPGGRVWIPPPSLAYNQTSLMVASALEVKLFVGHAGMHACVHIYCKHMHRGISHPHCEWFNVK